MPQDILVPDDPVDPDRPDRSRIMETIFNNLDPITGTMFSLTNHRALNCYRQNALAVFRPLTQNGELNLGGPWNHPPINTFLPIQHGGPRGLASVLRRWEGILPNHEWNSQRGLYTFAGSFQDSAQDIRDDGARAVEDAVEARANFEQVRDNRRSDRENRRAEQQQRRQERITEAREQDIDSDDVSFDSATVSSEESGRR